MHDSSFITMSEIRIAGIGRAAVLKYLESSEEYIDNPARMILYLLLYNTQHSLDGERESIVAHYHHPLTSDEYSLLC